MSARLAASVEATCGASDVLERAMKSHTATSQSIILTTRQEENTAVNRM
jgi:hypothetical protein